MTKAVTAGDMVAEAMARVKTLTPDAVREEGVDPDVLLVDLREEAELREHGTLPGAVHVPRGMLEFNADPASPKHREEFRTDRRTILYCAAGSRSALAADTLGRLGFTNVAHLGGGFAAWVEAGGDVER